LFIGDGQAACHWYTVTGTKLLVTGKLPVTSICIPVTGKTEMHITSIDQRPINLQLSSDGSIILPVTGMHFGNKKINEFATYITDF
jgi:hypothetical protein